MGREKAIEMMSWCVFVATEKGKALARWCDATERRQIGTALVLYGLMMEIGLLHYLAVAY